MSLRTRTWEVVEVAKPGDKLSKAFDICILSLIFFNVLAVILETVEAIQARHAMFLYRFEVFSVCVFTVEYLARLWSCTADPALRNPLLGRVKFATRAMPLVDLAAILPFYLPFLGLDLRFLRVLRLLRIVRIAKIGRYYAALGVIKSVVISRKESLVLTFVIMLITLLFSACAMYYCEHDAQPDAFPDIPSTMWWSVVTLTTVGYGDVYPVTALGKLFAALIAILGIGMFALPTAILGAGFVEAMSQKKSVQQRCPHCGKELYEQSPTKPTSHD